MPCSSSNQGGGIRWPVLVFICIIVTIDVMFIIYNEKGFQRKSLEAYGFLFYAPKLRPAEPAKEEFNEPWAEQEKKAKEKLGHIDKIRILPMTESGLTADWVFNLTNGSFWLPRPPSDPISGFESQMEGNEFETDYYRGRSGFMHPDKIDILMAQGTGFNAGDFFALWIAPMVSGRIPNLPSDPKTNKCSLAVVGSILQWGIRYKWGPGFIEPTKNLQKDTEKVFALRGPESYNIAQSSPYATTVSKVYGDPGLLMSWYYQPHNQTKSYSLCLIPHYVETNAPALAGILSGWNGAHQLNIKDPLFHIMDEIVKCEFVLSSSLHGIIFSDSYGVPNAHMTLTNHVTGGNFKFDDYFGAVNRTRTTLELVNRTSVKTDEIKYIMDKSSQPAQINLLPLWQNAPMHAQAYNRSRQEHLQFAQEYAGKFADILAKKPANLSVFLDQMGIAH